MSVNISTNRDEITYSRHMPSNTLYIMLWCMVMQYYLFTAPDKFTIFCKTSPSWKLTTIIFTTLPIKKINFKLIRFLVPLFYLTTFKNKRNLDIWYKTKILTTFSSLSFSLPLFLFFSFILFSVISQKHKAQELIPNRERQSCHFFIFNTKQKYLRVFLLFLFFSFILFSITSQKHKAQKLNSQ